MASEKQGPWSFPVPGNGFIFIFIKVVLLYSLQQSRNFKPIGTRIQNKTHLLFSEASFLSPAISSFLCKMCEDVAAAYSAV